MSLTQLLKKDNFAWNGETQVAFAILMKVMVELPIITILDFYLPFVIETDACNKGLGVVLKQQGRLIAFMSQILSDRTQLKSIYELEFMLIAMAVPGCIYGIHLRCNT